MSNKKLELNIDYDFDLIGIVTPAKPHRICSALNNKLDLSLSKQEDVKINDKKKKQQIVFPSFHFNDEVGSLEMHLVANKSEGHFLITERKMVDFFLVLKGYYPLEKKKRFIERLNELSIVQTAFEQEVASLKSKENLIMI